jgi:F-type H+-transporting ATPase subunit epsilon
MTLAASPATRLTSQSQINMAKDPATADMRIVVVTPETTLVDDTADFVALPLYDGELGIAPRHSPLIGRLGYGELRIKKGSDERRFYVDGGFVQVVDNVVSVLTDRAVEATAIDVAAAEQKLQSAVAERAPTDEQQAIRQRAIAQARGQIQVAGRVGK